MEGILQLGSALIIWLQNLGSWLVGPMEFFSFLGTEEFYLLIAPAILWCWDASLGLQMGLFLMINGSINQIFKLLLHGPRPYWVDSRVNSLASQTSFGVPSGHAQNAVVVWGTPAARLGKRIVWIISLIIIFLIGLSRLALGVHYLHDIIVGWLIGGLMLWIFIRWSKPVVNWVKRYGLSLQLLIVFAFSILLILFGYLAQRSSSDFALPYEWANNAAKAFPDDPIHPFDLSGLISNSGAFFGLAAGALWLERTGGFSAHGKGWQLAARYLLGVLGVFILWYGLGEIFPRGETLIYLMLRYVRYTLVGLWVTGIAPYIFRRVKLATSNSIT